MGESWSLRDNLTPRVAGAGIRLRSCGRENVGGGAGTLTTTVQLANMHN